MSYATDLADALDKVTMPGPVSKELRRLSAENEALINALVHIEEVAFCNDPQDLSGIVKSARYAISRTMDGGVA